MFFTAFSSMSFVDSICETDDPKKNNSSFLFSTVVAIINFPNYLALPASRHPDRLVDKCLTPPVNLGDYHSDD